MKRITGRLVSKNDKWYAVLNLYDTEGKRKQKWIGLDLEDKRGNKTEANHRLTNLLAQYNVGDLYLQETMTHADRERNRTANMLVEDYLAEWLEQHKPIYGRNAFERDIICARGLFCRDRWKSCSQSRRPGSNCGWCSESGC